MTDVTKERGPHQRARRFAREAVRALRPERKVHPRPLEKLAAQALRERRERIDTARDEPSP